MMRLANSTPEKLNAKLQLHSCAHKNFNFKPFKHKIRIPTQIHFLLIQKLSTKVLRVLRSG